MSIPISNSKFQLFFLKFNKLEELELLNLSPNLYLEIRIFEEINKLESVKYFKINLISCKNDNKFVFLANNISIPPNTIKFTLRLGTKLKFKIIDAILNRIRKKGLKFTFFGGDTRLTPEEYFNLFKKYPEVEISGPV